MGDIRGQKVAARGHRLTEFHEDRAQLLQREPQPLTAVGETLALEPHLRRQKEEKPQRPVQMGGPDKVIQAVFQQHTLNLNQPCKNTELHGRVRSAMRAARRSTSSRNVSTPCRNCSASARGTRSCRSWPRYSATLRTVVVAALRVHPNAARAKRPSWCAGTSPNTSDSSSSRSGLSKSASSRNFCASSASPPIRTSPRCSTASGAEPESASRLSGPPATSASGGASAGVPPVTADNFKEVPVDSTSTYTDGTAEIAMPTLRPASSAHNCRARGERGRPRFSTFSSVEVSMEQGRHTVRAILYRARPPTPSK